MTIKLDLVMIDEDTIDEATERQRARCRLYHLCYLALIGVVVLAALDHHPVLDGTITVCALLLRPLLMRVLTQRDEQ